jgi:hypothetical protein
MLIKGCCRFSLTYGELGILQRRYTRYFCLTPKDELVIWFVTHKSQMLLSGWCTLFLVVETSGRIIYSKFPKGIYNAFNTVGYTLVFKTKLSILTWPHSFPLLKKPRIISSYYLISTCADECDWHFHWQHKLWPE